MMKKFFLVLSALMLLSSGARAAGEDEGFYTKFGGAFTESTNKKVERGFSWWTGVGQKWAKVLRSELTFEYHRNSAGGIRTAGRFSGDSDGRFSSIALMAGTYVDLFSFKGVTPYIGGAVGLTRNKMQRMALGNIALDGEKNFRFAWKAAGGIGIDLPKNLILDIGYSYMDLGRFSTRTTLTPPGYFGPYHEDVKVREVFASLRYDF